MILHSVIYIYKNFDIKSSQINLILLGNCHPWFIFQFRPRYQWTYLERDLFKTFSISCNSAFFLIVYISNCVLANSRRGEPFCKYRKAKTKKNQKIQTDKKSTAIRFSFRLHFMFSLVNIGLKWLKSCSVFCNGMYASSFSFNAN